MQHIVIITPGFAANPGDTVCIPPLQAYVRQLSAHAKVSIVALHYPAHNSLYQWYGVPVYSTGGTWGKAFKIMRALQHIKHLHQQNPISLLHSFWLSDATLTAYLSTRLYNLPQLVTLMGQDALPNNRYLPFLPLKKIPVVALSTRHANTFTQTTGLTPQATIPWGINTADFPQPNNHERPIDVLGVGALTPLKNYSRFLQVIALLAGYMPHIKVTLAGSGPQLKQLQQQAQQLNLQSNVTFTGQLPRPQVLHLMQQSKVLLHTSQFESFGYVMAEALHSGMQVVSTPTGIAGEYGIHTGHTNEELAQMVIQALNQPTAALQAFTTMQQTVHSYLQLYQTL